MEFQKSGIIYALQDLTSHKAGIFSLSYLNKKSFVRSKYTALFLETNQKSETTLHRGKGRPGAFAGHTGDGLRPVAAWALQSSAHPAHLRLGPARPTWRACEGADSALMALGWVLRLHSP